MLDIKLFDYFKFSTNIDVEEGIETVMVELYRTASNYWTFTIERFDRTDTYGPYQTLEECLNTLFHDWVIDYCENDEDEE